MPRTQLLPLKDFTGGLNLRGDPFTLGENESPEMLNMEIDVRIGFKSRSPWEDYETVAEAGTWSPRSMYAHVKGNASEVLFLTNEGSLWIRLPGGSFVKQTGSFVADPHDADYASWKDDVYIAAGRSVDAQRFNGASDLLTALADPSGAGSWSNDPLVPESNTMPRAEFVASHDGRLWCAYTNEAGVDYPHRLRFSFSNDPDAWSELDYFDFPEGNGPITGILPLADHMLIFFPSTVFALYGSDLNSFQRVDASKTVGAANRQCIARSENEVYCASWPEGVYRITPNSVDEMTEALRPALESNAFGTNTDEQWLAWANRRLWWTVPYDKDGAPASAKTVFALDPSIGAWTMHRAGDGEAVAPLVTSQEANGVIGASRVNPTVIKFTTKEGGKDLIDGVEYPIDSYFRTRWMNAGMETVKKRWRRPDIVLKENDQPYEVTLYVYHDYQESDARRTKTLIAGADGAGGLWTADPEWDGTDASLETPEVGAPIWSETPDPDEAGWGLTAVGSVIERASGLGSAAAVQLEIRAEPGIPFSVGSIVFKYVLRRIR